MHYTEKNLLVAKIASVKGFREAQKGVLFANGKSVATDGFSLIEISAAGKDELPAHEPIILAASELKQFKASKDTPITLGTRENNTLTISSDKAIHIVPVINDRFPDYEHIFPKAKPLATVILNPSYLKDMASIFEKLGIKVVIEFNGENSPLVLRTEGSAVQSARAMIMPIKQ